MTDKKIENLSKQETEKWNRWRLTRVIRDILKLTEVNFQKLKKFLNELIESQENK